MWFLVSHIIEDLLSFIWRSPRKTWKKQCLEGFKTTFCITNLFFEVFWIFKPLQFTNNWATKALQICWSCCFSESWHFRRPPAAGWTAGWCLWHAARRQTLRYAQAGKRRRNISHPRPQPGAGFGNFHSDTGTGDCMDAHTATCTSTDSTHTDGLEDIILSASHVRVRNTWVSNLYSRQWGSLFCYCSQKLNGIFFFCLNSVFHWKKRSNSSTVVENAE